MRDAEKSFCFHPFPILETERLVLRPMDEKDSDAILELRSSLKVRAFLDRDLMHSKAEASDFIAKIKMGIADKRWFYWAICLRESGEFIGTICLWHLSHSELKAETGYELLPRFSRRGYMSEALKRVIKYGFDQMGLKRIEAYTHIKNVNSINVLIRNGFEPVNNIKNNEVLYLLKKEKYELP